MDSVKLTYQNKSIDCKVEDASEGNAHINIEALAQSLKLFTKDPGFKNSAAVDSKICYLDGSEGKLSYRGYTIESVCENLSFYQTANLLIHNKSTKEHTKTMQKNHIDWYKNPESAFQNHIQIIKSTLEIIPGIANMHPMSILMNVFSTLAGHFGKELKSQEQEQITLLVDTLLPLMPIIVANTLRAQQGLSWQEPDEEFFKQSYGEQFLTLYTGHKPTEMQSKTFETLLILHADHEQNASTHTLRAVGSGGVNLYACIASALASLWGSSHGGANEACIEMLKSIKESSQVESYINKAKDKNDAFRLMGFGHRVYKNYDPRARIIKKLYDPLLAENKSKPSPLFAIAQALEEQAMADEYFTSRKLYPNVDFYSGIIQMHLGIEINGFTAIFALSRMAGWLAHWKEMHEEPLVLIRPRQRYIGKKDQVFPKT